MYTVIRKIIFLESLIFILTKTFWKFVCARKLDFSAAETRATSNLASHGAVYKLRTKNYMLNSFCIPNMHYMLKTTVATPRERYKATASEPSGSQPTTRLQPANRLLISTRICIMVYLQSRLSARKKKKNNFRRTIHGNRRREGTSVDCFLFVPD